MTKAEIASMYRGAIEREVRQLTLEVEKCEMMRIMAWLESIDLKVDPSRTAEPFEEFIHRELEPGRTKTLILAAWKRRQEAADHWCDVRDTLAE